MIFNTSPVTVSWDPASNPGQPIKVLKIMLKKLKITMNIKYRIDVEHFARGE